MTGFTLSDFFKLLCGIALFLYGMQQAEKSLKKFGGRQLRQTIGVITRHRLTAYLTGFTATLITQSSSATTVLLVGLASVQLITLRQSLGVILGSDLGTTTTVGLFAFKFYLIAPLLIVSGFVMSLAKQTNSVSNVGKIILTAGFIFYGMSLMAEASGDLRNIPFVNDALAKSFTQPWIGILAGLLLTAFIHSSAATLAVTIALASHFTFPDGSAPGLGHFLPIVLGTNIGTCSTAFIALLQAEPEGARVAWAHLSFKVIGALLALPFVGVLLAFNVSVSWPAALQIAALHAAFNMYISLWFLPLLPLFDRTIRRAVAPADGNSQRFHTHFLHEKVLPFPVLALSQSIKEISRMSEIVVRMTEESLTLINRYNPGASNRIGDMDDEVDFLHEKIMHFLTRIGREEFGGEESARTYELTLVVTDIEHIGDIVSKRITELAEKIDRSFTPLSEEGRREIIDFFEITIGLLREALAAFTVRDSQLARNIHARKAAIEERFASYIDCHMNRLYNQKVESLRTTSIHVDLIEEIQRINHFTFRIAAHVLKIQHAE